MKLYLCHAIAVQQREWWSSGRSIGGALRRAWQVRSAVPKMKMMRVCSACSNCRTFQLTIKVVLARRHPSPNSFPHHVETNGDRYGPRLPSRSARFGSSGRPTPLPYLRRSMGKKTMASIDRPPARILFKTGERISKITALHIHPQLCGQNQSTQTSQASLGRSNTMQR